MLREKERESVEGRAIAGERNALEKGRRRAEGYVAWRNGETEGSVTEWGEEQEELPSATNCYDPSVEGVVYCWESDITMREMGIYTMQDYI